MLIFFHSNLATMFMGFRTRWSGNSSAVSPCPGHHSVNYFWAELFYKEPLPAGGGRALRARPPLRRAKESRSFDTRHNCFGVLSPELHRIVGEVFCSNRREQAPVNQPHHFTMPEPSEAVSSQRLLTTGTTWLNPAAFATSPFFHVSCPQRLSPLASIPAINRITDADSVTVFAKLYLFSSYAFAPRHLQRIRSGQ